MPEDYRIEGVKVLSFAGEDRGVFDATHIAGSEVIRGVGSETAIDRAFRARNIVELASPGIVSTDSIRYVLDGLRDVKPGDHLSDEEIRLFKEHIQKSEKPAIRRKRGDRVGEEEHREIDLGEADGAPAREGGIILVGSQPDMRTRTRRNCHYRIVSRHTVHQPYIRVSPLDFEKTPPVSQLYRSEETDRFVQNLKVVLEQKLSNEVTYANFGASASLTGTALEEFLRQYAQTVSTVVEHYTVTAYGSITVTVHSTVSNTWAWDGDDCPSDIGPPEVVRYVLVGPPLTYTFRYVFETWEMKGRISELAGEEWAKSKTRQHIMSLINTGAWLPMDLPLSDDLPTPTNF
jgi:hypothetical protein